MSGKRKVGGSGGGKGGRIVQAAWDSGRCEGGKRDGRRGRSIDGAGGQRVRGFVREVGGRGEERVVGGSVVRGRGVGGECGGRGGGGVSKGVGGRVGGGVVGG